MRGTNQLLKDHEEIIRKYKETIDSFHKKFEQSSSQKSAVDEQRVETDKNYLTALNQRDILNL